MHRIVIVIGLGMVLAGPRSTTAAETAHLPPPAFAVDHTRSDPARPVRPAGAPYTGPIADTHVHLDPSARGPYPDLADIVETAAKADVRRLTVMATPNEARMGRDGAEMRGKLREESERAGVAIRILCGSEYLSVWMSEASRQQAVAEDDIAARIDRLRADLDGGGCAGVGEIGLFHFQKWGNQAVIDTPPTFAPFLRLVDATATKGAWLDIHAEPVEPDGRSREDEVFGAVALMFARHPGLRLILSHTAMTNPVNARRLLETYPTLVFNFKLVLDHSKWRNLEPVCNEDGVLYEDWAQLMEAMPDRFLIGTDAKFGRKDYPARKYRKEIKTVRLALGSLEPTAAHRIAWDNAERLFGQ